VVLTPAWTQRWRWYVCANFRTLVHSTSSRIFVRVALKKLNRKSLPPSLVVIVQAMRVSLEEERERARKAGEGDGAPAAAEGTATAPESDMDADLRAAMAMSMGGDPGAMEVEGGAQDVSAMTEEEMMARALAMSMAGVPDSGSAAMETEGGGGAADGSADAEQMLQDPSFLSDVLAGLEGVDPEDAEIREAVSDLASKVDDAGKKKDEGGDGGGK
jgi:hypothetical protein